MKEKVLVRIKAPKCAHHIEHNMGYLTWQFYCEANDRKGLKQKQCPTCGYWFWPDEMGKENTIK